MFSNRVRFSRTYSVRLLAIQSAAGVSYPLVVHGVSLRCHFLWHHNHLVCKVGVVQPSDSLLCLCVQMSVVLESSSARCRGSVGHLLVCADERNSLWRVNFSLSEVVQLLENGWLNITTYLDVCRPMNFRNVSLSSSFSFPAPQNCVEVFGQHQGIVFVLLKISDMSEGVQQWCIYAFPVFNPDGGVIMGRLPVRPNDFVGTRFSSDRRTISVTQVNDNDSQIRMDILHLDCCHLETRFYPIPSADQDLQWTTAVARPEGWVCVARGCREGAELVLHYRFWLLGDDREPQLLAALAEPTAWRAEAAAAVNGHFYCMVTSPEFRCFMYVSSWERPNNWHPYEFAPYPDFDTFAIFYEWGRLLLAADSNGSQTNEHSRDVLFELGFEGVDCLVQPYMVLPEGVPTHWRMGKETLLCYSPEEQLLSLVQMQPPTLKRDAMVTLGRLLGRTERRDAFGRPVWVRWREKLTHLLQMKGEAATDYM